MSSGSPAKLTLRPKPGFESAVSVVRELRRRGVTASVAKHAAERLLDGKPTALQVKHYDEADMGRDLARLGVLVRSRSAVTPKSIRSIRERLKLSQEQFANAYALELRTLQNWEQGRGDLDPQTALLFRLIDRDPDLVETIAAEG